MRGPQPLEQEIAELLAEPEHEAHRLHDALARLWGAHRAPLIAWSCRKTAPVS